MDPIEAADVTTDTFEQENLADDHLLHRDEPEPSDHDAQ